MVNFNYRVLENKFRRSRTSSVANVRRSFEKKVKHKRRELVNGERPPKPSRELANSERPPRTHRELANSERPLKTPRRRHALNRNNSCSMRSNSKMTTVSADPSSVLLPRNELVAKSQDTRLVLYVPCIPPQLPPVPHVPVCIRPQFPPTCYTPVQYARAYNHPSNCTWTAVNVKPCPFVVLDGTGMCGVVPYRRDVKGFNRQSICTRNMSVSDTTGPDSCLQIMSALALGGVLALITYTQLQRIPPPILEECTENAVVPTTSKLILPAIQKTPRILTIRQEVSMALLRSVYMEVCGQLRTPVYRCINGKSKLAACGDGQDSSVEVYKGGTVNGNRQVKGNRHVVRTTYPVDELQEKEHEYKEDVLSPLPDISPTTHRHVRGVLAVTGMSDDTLQSLVEEQLTEESLAIQAASTKVYGNDTRLEMQAQSTPKQGKATKELLASSEMSEHTGDETPDVGSHKKHGGFCRFRKFLGRWLCCRRGKQE